MRSEKEIIGRLYTIARLIDNNNRDKRFWEGAFFEILNILELEQAFKKALLPETVVRTATGKSFTKSNYSRSLDNLFNKKIE